MRSLKQPIDTPVRQLKAAVCVAAYCEPRSGERHCRRRQRAHILGLTYARPDPDALQANAALKRRW
jgi:hypothetical protein